MKIVRVNIFQLFLKPPVFLFLLLLPFNLTAKTVRGIVVDVSSNEPLKDVVVMIIDTSSNVRFMQMTDSTGLFLISGINEDKF